MRADEPLSTQCIGAGAEAVLTARVEASLHALPRVVEAAARVRVDREGRRRTVAYVQPAGQCSARQLREDLAARPGANAGGGPDDIVLVSSLPRDACGEIDFAALEALPVMDEELAARCEREAGPHTGASEAAAVIRPRTIAPPRVSWDGGTIEAMGVPREVRELAAARPDAKVAICEGGRLDLGPDTPTTLAALLARCCAEFGQKQIVHVEGDGSTTVFSYHRLEADARRVLSGLRAAGVSAGAFVVLQLERTADFLAGFWGCVLGGCVPVPVSIASSYQPDNAVVRKLRHAWDTLDRPIVLASDALAPVLREVGERAEMSGVHIVPIGELLECEPAPATHHAAPDDLALLLFTSASTGASKAVTHTHRTLIARSIATCRFNGHGSDDVSVNWMPLDHVGGIVMFHLRDVACGAQQVHAPTNWILEQPLRWLDLIDRYRATTTWAPNFAFALINERAAEVARGRWDLSCMRFVLNGGEMIVPATARRFMRLLAPHGLPRDAMKPAWGMSETASGVTFDHDFTPDDETAASVPVGRPIPGFAMRIVDANDVPLLEGQIGRLQVRGDMVTPAYYRDAARNAEAFTADGWFNTGDLARVDGGRLTITGREKDEIIINGANVSSAEIEAAAAGAKGVDASAVAATSVRRPGQNTDDVAVFFKPAFEMGDDDALGAAVRAIRAALASSLGFTPATVVPLPEREFPRTEIGKIQRRVLRERLQEGRYGHLTARVQALVTQDGLPNWFFAPAWRARTPRHRDVGRDDFAVVLTDGSGLMQEASRRLDARRILLPGDALATGAFVAELKRAVPRLVLFPFGYGAAPRVGDLLALIRMLAENNPAGARVRLVLASSRHPSADSAAARGVLATATRELPWLECRRVEFDGADVVRDAALLAGEAVMREVAGDVAYIDGRRHVRLLERIDAPPAKSSVPIRPGGHYVISGGAGGVGVELAKHLMSRYQARILLLGRRPSDHAQVRDALALLSQLGEVRYAQVNVTDETGVAAACDSAARAWGGRLDGAFHAAGVIEDRPLVQETAESLAASMLPKVQGARILHDVLQRHGRGAAPALLVLFSSVAGYFGGSGAGAYAAANAALGGFADEVAADGAVDVRCLYWSRWSQTGMGARDEMEEAARAAGFHALAVADAVASLDIALAQPHRHIVIGIDESNPQLRPHVAGRVENLEQVSLYCAAADAHEGSAPVPQTVTDAFGTDLRVAVNVIAQLPRDNAGRIDHAALTSDRDDAADDRPSDELQREILDTFRRVLDVTRMGVDDSFLMFGGNSLLATQIVSRLRASVAPALTVRDVFECPTTTRLSRRIREQAGRASHDETIVPIAPVAAEAIDPLSDLSGLSDEKITELLEQVMRQEATP